MKTIFKGSKASCLSIVAQATGVCDLIRLHNRKISIEVIDRRSINDHQEQGELCSVVYDEEVVVYTTTSSRDMRIVPTSEGWEHTLQVGDWWGKSRRFRGAIEALCIQFVCCRELRRSHGGVVNITLFDNVIWDKQLAAIRAREAREIAAKAAEAGKFQLA